MSWTDLPLLAIDTETTGVDCFADRIVEVAVVQVEPTGEAVEQWCAVVDPGIEVPEAASDVHGITTERARAEGIEPRRALHRVAELVSNHLTNWVGGARQAPIVMYNARFDWPLLITEADRHDVDFPAWGPILDPYLLDRMVDRYRKGKRRLTDVTAHYGVKLSAEEAHGALADAVATGRIMRRLIERYPDEIAGRSLCALWLDQVRGHEEDRCRFVDWMRRNNDPAFDSPPGWPIPAGVAS